MRCSNCGAENPNSAKFCKHCGGKFLQNQDQITRSDRTRHKKSTLLVTGIAVLAIVAVAGYFFGRGDKKTEEKSATDNTVATYKQQAPSGGNEMGESDSYDERRLASFRAIAASTVAASIQCDDGGGTLQSGVSGDVMCNKNYPSTVWPAVAASICAEGTNLNYIVDAVRNGGGSGLFSYSVKCTIAGTEYTTTCDDGVVSTTP